MGLRAERAGQSIVATATSRTVAGSGGPIAEGVTKVNIGFNNLGYSYFPGPTKVKAGDTVTFTNVGDIPHTATELKQAKWDAGKLEKGQSKAITFSEPGSYYFICTPHPWMYGQIIVE